ncbi:hypothetical protein AB0N14_18900 [Streptomyces sp. NPDC051104]
MTPASVVRALRLEARAVVVAGMPATGFGPPTGTAGGKGTGG